MDEIDFNKMPDVGLGGGQSVRDQAIRDQLLNQVRHNKRQIDKYDNDPSATRKNDRQKNR